MSCTNLSDTPLKNTHRLNGSRAKRSNPNCAVEFNIDEDGGHGKSFVDLHFADEDKRRVYLADRRADEITRMMEEKGSELETKSVLQEVGCCVCVSFICVCSCVSMTTICD